MFWFSPFPKGLALSEANLSLIRKEWATIYLNYLWWFHSLARDQYKHGLMIQFRLMRCDEGSLLTGIR